MKHNISVKFRYINQPNSLLELIDRETKRLEARQPRIQRVAIMVDRPNRRRRKGDFVRAQITISLPGKELVTTKQANGMNEADNASLALFSAFDAADAAVNTYVERQRDTRLKQRAPAALVAC